MGIVNPKMGPAQYKTYQILAPTSSHFRVATCEEMGCEKFVNGFKVLVDELTDLGKAQAVFIRSDRTRPVPGEFKTTTGITEFTYPAGTKCMAYFQHKTRIERDELFYVRDGDRRGNPRGTAPRLHKNAAEWQEDFAEHQDKIHDALERG